MLSTAYYSTAIPTIETYLGGATAVKQLQQLYQLRHLIGKRPVPAVLKGIITRTSAGPTQPERESDEALHWARLPTKQASRSS